MDINLKEIVGDAIPMDADKSRQFALERDVLPMMEKWGFETEFLREIPKMHPQQEANFKRMRKMITSGDGAIVALVGPRGLGKTTLVAQFALEIAWKNYNAGMEGRPYRKHVIYKKCARLVERYKPLYADFGCIEAESLRNSMDFLVKDQEYLVIDELYDCSDMKFKKMALVDLCDRRYSKKLPTILISNQTAEEFRDSTDESIISRLGQYGAILPCRWKSFREK